MPPRGPSQFQRTISHYVAIADMLEEVLAKNKEVTFRREGPYTILNSGGREIKTFSIGSVLSDLLEIDQDLGWKNAK